MMVTLHLNASKSLLCTPTTTYMLIFQSVAMASGWLGQSWDMVYVLVMTLIYNALTLPQPCAVPQPITMPQPYPNIAQNYLIFAPKMPHPCPCPQPSPNHASVDYQITICFLKNQSRDQ